jgi:hypothetical protein
MRTNPPYCRMFPNHCESTAHPGIGGTYFAECISISADCRVFPICSTAKVVIRRGERWPDSVEFEEFPETVDREAPSSREYRYVHRENRTYLVDPGERQVIEEID